MRTKRYTLVRWQGPRFVELYDRTIDPDQLTNPALEPAYRRVRRALADYLDTLEDCKDSTCQNAGAKAARAVLRRWLSSDERSEERVETKAP
ncbi:hypothetical protein LP418_26020 [Nocardioides sp. B-3]|nr:hypothetical protein [Nocardioides sp. B-3]UUZ59279.1 hypothetical protein LP418_26020 [Nocardioides sp. B-3]